MAASTYSPTFQLPGLYGNVPTSNNKAPNLPLMQPQQQNQMLTMDPDSQANLRQQNGLTPPQAGSTSAPQQVQPMAPQQQPNVQQQNTQVLSKLQQNVMQGNQQAISPMIQQRTQQLLENPTLGYDPTQYKQMQMEQFDRQSANAMEAARQKLGDTSQAGYLQRDYLNNALVNEQNRSDLSRSIDQTNYENSMNAFTKALAEGRTTEKQSADIATMGIDNLVKARGAAEGERAQTQADSQQMAVLEKTFGQDMAKLVASQDWQSAQNQLDRDAAIAKQSNDINAQQNLVKLQASLDMERLGKTQDFTAFQADLDRRQQLAVQGNDIEAKKYLAGLQIQADAAQLQKTQDFQAVQNDIERKWKSTEATADREQQNSIVERQLALDKWKQENGQQFTEGQNALNRALQLTLADKDAATQTSLMELKSKIDNDMLTRTQDFEAVQNDLDRREQEALQKGDIQGQMQIEQLRGQITMAAQQKQQEFEKAQQNAAQIWQSGEKANDRDLQYAMQANQIAADDAKQQNDIAAQKYLQDQNAQLQLKMQTNNMSQEEKMAYLANDLSTARANGDMNRQMQLLTFQHAQELESLQSQYGYDAAKIQLQSDLQAALQTNDAANQASLIQLRATLDAQERAKDRALEQTAQQNQQFAQLYSAIQAQVESGILSPESAIGMLQNQMRSTGMNVNLVASDPNADQLAIEKEYNLQRAQWAMTHDGDTTGFNQWVNDTVFGDSNTVQYLTGEKPPEALATDKAAQEQILKTRAPLDLSGTAYVDDQGRTAYRFNGAIPSEGYVNIDGKLYQVQGAVKDSPTNQSFMVKDVNTGELKQISANTNVTSSDKGGTAGAINSTINSAGKAVNSSPVVQGIKSVVNWLF